MRCPGCGSSVKVEEGDPCPVCSAETAGSALPTRPEAAIPGGGHAFTFIPGALFADRYTVIEKVGEGGMGVVYKAMDGALGGTVALKLVQPEFSRDPACLRRFRHEVRLTRSISHPNVCRVHDIGESAGHLYLSMEWIEGETLRLLINQAGAVERGRALRIAEKIALALAAAHARGIIHRDLKPENVMIDARGETYVLDFGLAVSFQEARRNSGRVAGTPRYMAPEQIRGEPVDARTDLYALGLILGELLTGGRRFDGGGSPPMEARSEAARHIAPLLAKLTAPDREARFASAAEAALAIRQARRAATGLETGTEPSIQDTSRKHRRIGFGALAVILIAALGFAGYAWLNRPHDPRPANVSREAWARYVQASLGFEPAAPTLHEIDDAIQMFHRAIKAEPTFALAWAALGRAYWTRYRESHDDATKQEAQKAVREALRLSPQLPEAHATQGFGYQSESNFAAARAEYREALRLKPELDWAWARLGTTCGEMGQYEEGLEALERAIALKPKCVQYRLMLGKFHDRTSNYEKSVEAFRKAIELDPGCRMAWTNLGAELVRMDRTSDAVGALQKALAIEDNASTRSNLGTLYFNQKQFDKAAAEYRRASELDPAKATHWGNLGDALLALGSQAEARAAYAKATLLASEAVERSPLDPDAHEELALYCARSRNTECARKEAARAFELKGDSSEIHFTNAIVSALAGRTAEALDWLDRGVQMGLSRVQIANEPAFASMQSEPRFVRILQLAR